LPAQNAQNTGAFGQQQNTGSLWNKPPTQANTSFGQLGAPTSTNTLFGGQTAGNTTSMFGAKPAGSLFGAPQQQQPQQGTSLFGAQQNTSGSHYLGKLNLNSKDLHYLEVKLQLQVLELNKMLDLFLAKLNLKEDLYLAVNLNNNKLEDFLEIKQPSNLNNHHYLELLNKLSKQVRYLVNPLKLHLYLVEINNKVHYLVDLNHKHKVHFLEEILKQLEAYLVVLSSNLREDHYLVVNSNKEDHYLVVNNLLEDHYLEVNSNKEDHYLVANNLKLVECFQI